MGRNLRVDVRGAEERILTVSTRTGGCLISIRDDDGRLRIEVYRADETVDVIAPLAQGAPPGVDGEVRRQMRLYAAQLEVDDHPGVFRAHALELAALVRRWLPGT